MGMCFDWDEPEGCSPRGWATFVGPHPDDQERSEPVSRVCGWYLSYADAAAHSGSRGPNGEAILASAYIFRRRTAGSSDERIGNGWFTTVADAKAWIEASVQQRLNAIAGAKAAA